MTSRGNHEFAESGSEHRREVRRRLRPAEEVALRFFAVFFLQEAQLRFVSTPSAMVPGAGSWRGHDGAHDDALSASPGMPLTIAEGVETEAQLRFLQKEDCEKRKATSSAGRSRRRTSRRCSEPDSANSWFPREVIHPLLLEEGGAKRRGVM